MKERLEAFNKHFGKELHFWQGDLRENGLVEKIFREFQPEAIVHLGGCPSTPYSMMNVHHAVFVQTNNITTTFNLIFALRVIRPEAHLVEGRDNRGVRNT